MSRRTLSESIGAALMTVLMTALLWKADTAGAQAADIDDVYCALCHFEQGDEFVESIHYQKGMLLCNDCHGGDPFEIDDVAAKAPSTGFIGKPQRGDIAQICGKCHSGPAGFFAQGPHHDWQTEANPTCITCHDNHRVFDATLALMDEVCADCHVDDARALNRGEEIRQHLERSDAALRRAASRLDSLRDIDPALQRILPVLATARSTLREADPATHALDVELIESIVEEAEVDRLAVEERLDESVRHRQRRGWAVIGIWVFVMGNVALLTIKGRQLDRDRRRQS